MTFRKLPEGQAIDKAPGEKLDYTFDWTAWLDSTAGETISSHTVTVDNGATLESDSESGGKVTAWISGGALNKIYTVTCTVTTSAGRIGERSFLILITNRR